MLFFKQTKNSPLDDLDAVGGHPVVLLGPQGHHEPGEHDGGDDEAGVVPEHAVGLYPHQEQDRQRGDENQLGRDCVPNAAEGGFKAAEG